MYIYIIKRKIYSCLIFNVGKDHQDERKIYVARTRFAVPPWLFSYI